jgi:hypothetical protein
MKAPTDIVAIAEGPAHSNLRKSSDSVELQ